MYKCLIILSALFFLSCNLAPGGYPYAERYELNYSDEDVKIAIKEFKERNPQYIVPDVTIDGSSFFKLIDEPSEYPSHYYCIYFYYPEENRIVLSWIRFVEKEKTTFALVSINDGLKVGNWKEINKDFNRSENREEKKKFEKRILNEIKTLLANMKY